jgi:hypothetical protein
MSFFYLLSVSMDHDYTQRLNIELDLKSLFGLHVHSCTHRLRLCKPPRLPRIWAHIRGRNWSAKIDIRQQF